MTDPRPEVIEEVAKDMTLSIIGITNKHDSTAFEDLVAASTALITLIKSVTDSESSFVACVDQVAERMKSVARDPEVFGFTLDIGAKQ